MYSRSHLQSLALFRVCSSLLVVSGVLSRGYADAVRFLLAAGIVVTLQGLQCWGQAPVDSYKAYLAQLEAVSFSTETRDRILGENSEFANKLIQEWAIDFAGKRFWKRSRNIDKTRQKDVTAETLVTPETIYNVDVGKGTNEVIKMTSYLQKPPGYWARYAQLGYLGPTFGYLKVGSEYLDIAGFLSSATSASVSHEGDLSVVQVESGGEKVRIAINPTRGGMGEQIEYTRTNGDVRSKAGKAPRYISWECKEAEMFEGVWVPTFSKCKVEYGPSRTALPSGVKIVNGLPTVVRGQEKDERDSHDEPGATLEAEIRIIDMRLDEIDPSAFKLTAAVANGQVVTMQDARHLDYVWFDGNPVPRASANLQGLQNADFLSGDDEGISLSIVLTIVLLLALLAGVVWNRMAT